MRKVLLSFLYLSINLYSALAQSSTSQNLKVQDNTDRTLFFDVSDAGESLPIIWGVDAGGWTNYGFWEISTRYFGAENVRLTRIPTFPWDGELTDGTALNQAQKNDISDRLNQIAVSGQKVQVMLNPGGADDGDLWYREDWSRYALLMKLAKDYIESFGHTVVSISGFNEPDPGYAPATMQDNSMLFDACKNSGYFDENIRYCGGNTLNPDFAYDWYNYSIPAGVNEGNTHQLAGIFDNYASFYQSVKANGHYATNDEVHNIMEAIVGAEYGLQSAIFWPDFYNGCNYARGELVKATNGERLGYAEHRSNWTAAAVYRHTDGQVKAYLGGSERQATTTSYRFVSKGQPVFFEGKGPQYEFVIEVPGGNGYGVDQPNPERVLPITYGKDVQPEVDGDYILVNKASGKVLEVVGGYTTDGANIKLGTYTQKNYQQWKLSLVPLRTYGDYSYYSITSKSSGKALDVNNFSMANGGNVQQWSDGLGTNQLWYLEYVADGYFNIRSKNSTYYLRDYNSNAVQWEDLNSDDELWRLIPVGAEVEFEAPSQPQHLTVTPRSASMLLNWNKNNEADLAGYAILRAESPDGPYYTIARSITDTVFVDNSALANVQYSYAIEATDFAMNTSEQSQAVSASLTNEKELIALYEFEDNLQDSTLNLNHAARTNILAYSTGKVGERAIGFSGIYSFVQLPSTVANHQEITIATWVNWTGGNPWQRIFDFGNGEDEYMFLTPYSASNKLTFAIKNGGEEQTIETTKLSNYRWIHIAVTLGEHGGTLYLDGEKVAENPNINISPLDFKPVLNYIAKSQFMDPYFRGRIDDFRIYNYALSSDEVNEVFEGESTGINAIPATKELELWPNPVSDILYISQSHPTNAKASSISIYNLNGQLMQQQIAYSDSQVDVSKLPQGTYLLKMSTPTKNMVKKFIKK